LAHIVARSPTTMAALSAAPALAARLSAVRGKTARKSSRDVARRAIQVDTSADAAQAGSADPLMLRAIRGEDVERPPIWMMRQAGRYMKIYQDLCKKHPTFRERSETVDLAVEISLQPWDAFKPDGVILFSDILTPLSGMNIPFDIVKGTGPIIMNPVRSMEDVKAITPLEPEESMPFVGESLGLLRKAVGNDAAVLGFVGAPFTLASYIVEGGTSSHYKVIKKMAFDEPEIYHALLESITDSVITYVKYQADSGAQVVQIFDSWASEFSPADFDKYCLPYLTRIVREVKQTHPDLPLILYSSGSGGFLERLASTGADVISLDGTVDMADARARLGADQAVQGNMDPVHLFAKKEFIVDKVHDTIKKAGNKKHVMNLGHGVMQGTPEENVATFFQTVRDYRY
jgi:uroporphyrinogen decarboxylase